ncbi:MAG: DUF1566 domain-containing protein [Bacteroidia bacterium]|nr:DUF1566 domain-containing protein [Bacteroidia bacterium]
MNNKHQNFRLFISLYFAMIIVPGFSFSQLPYKIPGTGVVICYDTVAPIPCPQNSTDPFFGQFQGAPMSYHDNGDGTVSDLVTGLMWQKSRNFKISWAEAASGAATCTTGGYNDWRMPAIKELYSLINFNGKCGTTPQNSTPYIDTAYFQFLYGDTTLGERLIDCQDWSSTQYVAFTMMGDSTVFGVNFADGRIKGYPKYQPGTSSTVPYTLYVRYVRNNPLYGINDFTNNGDSTISDHATGLMWTKFDNDSAMKWQDALSWVQEINLQNFKGHNDWRLPHAKELQSIVDYTRAPAATNSPAINPMFYCTQIIDEAGHPNWPYYWASTTHREEGLGNSGNRAVYVAFGTAGGWMQIPPNSGNYQLLDVHGAGAQRSDPKTGNPADYPYGMGPQGDVIRIYNYARLVRNIDTTTAINEIRKVEEFRVMPDPFTNYLDIVIPVNSSGISKIELINDTGRLLESEVINTNPGDKYRFRLNRTYPSGLYLVRLITSDHIYIKKVIRQ